MSHIVVGPPVRGRRKSSMTEGELRTKREAQGAEYNQAEDNDFLTLTEAASESGYSPDHLGRLVRGGVIRNAGRTNAPKIRRADLPRKATAQLPRGRAGSKFVGATPTQIARAVVTSDREDPR